MNAVTMVSTGMPRTMTTWIKLGCGALAVAAAWWGLSSFDYERYFSPAALAQWLNDAGPLGPLLLIGGMVGAVIVPPIPSLPLDLAAGAAFGPFYGALYAVIGAEIGLLTPPFGISCFVIKAAIGDDSVTLRDIFMGALPFAIVMLLVLVVLIVFPGLSLVFT